MIRWLTILLMVPLAFGCEPASRISRGDDDDSSEDEGVDGSAGGDSDGDGDADRDSDSSTECDRQEFSIEPMPVRLMILQDITGSMNLLMGEPGAEMPKWNVAKFALTDMLNKMVGKGIEIGFDIFNDLDPSAAQAVIQCGTDLPLIIDCALDNETNIINKLQTIVPEGSTPIYCSMGKFLEPDYAPKFLAGGAARFLLLISDGADTCGTTCNMKNDVTVQDMTDRATELLEAGIKTFVIGFDIPADPKKADPQQLNAIAAAGGTEFTTFFNAQSGNDLEQALTEVGKAIVNCVFELDEPDAKADPEKVNFYFGEEVIPHDEDCAADKGWTWADDTHTKVEFCNNACDSFAGDMSKKITASFGCPTIEVDVQ